MPVKTGLGFPEFTQFSTTPRDAALQFILQPNALPIELPGSISCERIN